MKFPDPPPRPTITDMLAGAAVVAGIVLLASPLIFLAVLVKTFVISTLWGWYMVPYFGVEPLPMVVAFGIILLVGYLMMPLMHHEDKRTWQQKLWAAIAVPPLFLFMGWLGTFFM